MTGIKVLGVGSAIVDILVRADDAFIAECGVEKGGMVMFSQDGIDDIIAKGEKRFTIELVPGGSAANTIFGLQKLGIPTALLGKTGLDDEGAFYRNSYKATGGDSSIVRTHETLKTGRCVSLVTPDSERTMCTDLGAAAAMTADEISNDDFKGITHVVIEGYILYNMPYFMRVIKLALENKCKIALDLSAFQVVRTFRNELNSILEKVDIIFANEDEAGEFIGSETSFDPVNALDKLSTLCETAVVKLGKKGSMIRKDKIDAVVPAEIVDAIDTTGAGDLWQAGFLYGYLNEKSPEICGRFASVTGAEIVKVMGARIPDERWDYIKKRFVEIENKFKGI